MKSSLFLGARKNYVDSVVAFSSFRSRLVCLLACALVIFGITGCSSSTHSYAAQGIFPAVTFHSDDTLTIAQEKQEPHKLHTRLLRHSSQGRELTKDDVITARYQGQTLSGKIFETTYHRGWTPVPLSLSKLSVSGLRQALIGRHVGDLLEVVVPARLAYGKTAKKDATGKVLIPPSTSLIYLVDIIDAYRLNDLSSLHHAQAVSGASIRKRLPQGISVVKNVIGEEPVVKVASGAQKGIHAQRIFLSLGRGRKITPNDYVAQHLLVVPLGKGEIDSSRARRNGKNAQVYSDWNHSSLMLTPDVIGNDLNYVGVRVGSRMLIILPSSGVNRLGKRQNSTPIVMVVDVAGALSTKKSQQ